MGEERTEAGGTGKTVEIIEDAESDYLELFAAIVIYPVVESPGGCGAARDARSPVFSLKLVGHH